MKDKLVAFLKWQPHKIHKQARTSERKCCQEGIAMKTRKVAHFNIASTKTPVFNFKMNIPVQCRGPSIDPCDTLAF